MFIIKYFIIGLIIITVFISASLGIIDDNLINKITISAIIIAVFLILNFIAKIAWRILFFILFVFFGIYLLSYLGLIEFSLPWIKEFSKEAIEKGKDLT